MTHSIFIIPMKHYFILRFALLLMLSLQIMNDDNNLLCVGLICMVNERLFYASSIFIEKICPLEGLQNSTTSMRVVKCQD